MAIAGLSTGDTAWVLTSAAFVLLMTPGLAFFYGGLVKGHNVLNTMMMSIIAMGICSVSWAVLGFSLAFGGEPNPLIGDFSRALLNDMTDELWPGTRIPALLFVIFQMTFAVIGAAIISGSVAERIRFSAYSFFIVIWSIVVYAPVCHWVWGPGGWIVELGAKDFAGGMVVHECTAVSALVLARCVGHRVKHPSEESAPHNIPFVVLGGALLWFGWSGFNGGSALAANEVAALAVMNTYMAAASSLVTWAILERFCLQRCSATGAVTGAVVGLVVITPGAGFVTPAGALLMGMLGCLLVYPTFNIKCPIQTWADDNLDAFPCHGVGGFVGTVLTGIFAQEGGVLYGGGLALFMAQVFGALGTAAYSAAMTWLIWVLLHRVVHMRVGEEEELLGLDGALHGETAYDAGASPMSLAKALKRARGEDTSTTRDEISEEEDSDVEASMA